jgi:hypothetical protein
MPAHSKPYPHYTWRDYISTGFSNFVIEAIGRRLCPVRSGEKLVPAICLSGRGARTEGGIVPIFVLVPLDFVFKNRVLWKKKSDSSLECQFSREKPLFLLGGTTNGMEVLTAGNSLSLF